MFFVLIVNLNPYKCNFSHPSRSNEVDLLDKKNIYININFLLVNLFIHCVFLHCIITRLCHVFYIIYVN